MKKTAHILALLLACALLAAPARAASAQDPAAPEVAAPSAVLIERQTGTVLYAKGETERRPPASVTKVMTLLLVMEAVDSGRLSLDESVPVSAHAAGMGGSQVYLKEGERLSVSDLIKCVAVVSGNDCAVALAERLSGSESAFVDQMNQKAQALGMEDTHFVTPSGLDGEDAQGLGHLSTAYDMALLARAALEDQAFRQLCSSPSLAVEFAEPVKRVTYTNHNKLLAQYQGCVGVKTGFTKEAGRCLVSAAERDGALLIAVTLNAPNDWEDHTALLDYGFSQVELYPLAGGDVRLTVPVVGSPVEAVSLRGSNGGEVTLPLGQGAQVERVVHAPKFLYAPVEAGEQVGEICWYLEGQLLGSAPLTAAGAAPLQEKAPSLWERLFG